MYIKFYNKTLNITKHKIFFSNFFQPPLNNIICTFLIYAKVVFLGTNKKDFIYCQRQDSTEALTMQSCAKRFVLVELQGWLKGCLVVLRFATSSL